jgi:hypothetical protein
VTPLSEALTRLSIAILFLDLSQVFPQDVAEHHQICPYSTASGNQQRTYILRRKYPQCQKALDKLHNVVQYYSRLDNALGKDDTDDIRRKAKKAPNKGPASFTENLCQEHNVELAQFFAANYRL